MDAAVRMPENAVQFVMQYRQGLQKGSLVLRGQERSVEELTALLKEEKYLEIIRGLLCLNRDTRRGWLREHVGPDAPHTLLLYERAISELTACLPKSKEEIPADEEAANEKFTQIARRLSEVVFPLMVLAATRLRQDLASLRWEFACVPAASQIDITYLTIMQHLFETRLGCKLGTFCTKYESAELKALSYRKIKAYTDTLGSLPRLPSVSWMLAYSLIARFTGTKEGSDLIQSREEVVKENYNMLNMLQQ